MDGKMEIGGGHLALKSAEKNQEAGQNTYKGYTDKGWRLDCTYHECNQTVNYLTTVLRVLWKNRKRRENKIEAWSDVCVKKR